MATDSNGSEIRNDVSGNWRADDDYRPAGAVPDSMVRRNADRDAARARSARHETVTLKLKNGHTHYKDGVNYAGGAIISLTPAQAHNFKDKFEAPTDEEVDAYHDAKERPGQEMTDHFEMERQAEKITGAADREARRIIREANAQADKVRNDAAAQVVEIRAGGNARTAINPAGHKPSEVADNSEAAREYFDSQRPGPGELTREENVAIMRGGEAERAKEAAQSPGSDLPGSPSFAQDTLASDSTSDDANKDNGGKRKNR